MIRCSPTRIATVSATADLAREYPDLVETWISDPLAPLPGKCAHFLVTGLSPSKREDDLGTDSEGNERPNDYPCP